MPRPSTEEILAAVQEHGSITKAAPVLGHHERTIRRWLKAADADIPKPEGPTREEILEAEVKDLRKRATKNRSLDVQAERVLQDIAMTLRPAEPIYQAPPPLSPGTKSHVQALILSDLHCGEVVEPEAVNGLNEFNWDVLVERMARIERSLLSFQQARPWPVEELHLWLLGDNLSGNIHEELAETNEFPVAEQAYRVGMLIAQFIERLVPHYPKIVVNGVAGNHPRVGKPHSSKQVFDSFDWLAYKLADAYLARYESVSCSFPQSAFKVAEIAGQKILLWHGDGVRSSMPGVPWGGVMRRWNELSRQYAQQGTYLDGLAVGHFHQANVVQSKIFMNGSVIGLNEYGLKNFGSGEKPTQLLLTFQPGKSRLTDVSYINP